MQQVIEEILKTEEDCARRLEDERKAVERRRAEIESVNADRIRTARQQAEEDAARRLRQIQDHNRRWTEEEILRARQKAELDFASNQTLLEGIVEKITALLIGGE